MMLEFIQAVLAMVFAMLSDSDSSNRQSTALFNLAEKNYNNPSPSEKTDSLAFLYYRQFLETTPADAHFSHPLFTSALHLGILHQIHEEQREAIRSYHQALSIRRRFQLPDSLDFHPYLFCGNAHYFLDHFDSAIYYFEKAEQHVIASKAPLPDEERLYNSLGAIYFEGGNFSQSVNYFQKALEIVQTLDPGNTEAYYSFQSNKASALRKLQQFHEAASIYRQLIPLQIGTSQLMLNLGSIFLDLNLPDSTLYYMEQVKNPEEANPTVWNNHLGYAWILKNDLEKADSFLAEAGRHLTTTAMRKDNRYLGNTLKLRGILEEKKGNYLKALQNYQLAIVQYDYDYHDTSIYSNPLDFEGGFVSYELFECLHAKAKCWQSWYLQIGSDTYADAATQSYRSAFELVSFLKSSFDNEEARLFIGRTVLPAYQSAVDLLIRRFNENDHEPSLDLAFEWVEKSKARALSLELREDEIKGISGIPDSLLARESDLHFVLSKLQLQQSRLQDSTGLATIRRDITDCRLQLSRLSDKLNEYPAYYQRKHAEERIELASLQQYLDRSNSRLLAYFQSGEQLYAFILDGRKIHAHTLPFGKTEKAHLAQFTAALTGGKDGEKYAGSPSARAIYQELVQKPMASGKATQSIIISAHEMLRRIPFEALENEQGRFLLESFDISYQFSSYFLQTGLNNEKPAHPGQLVVAPFTSDMNPVRTGFETLRFTREEIRGLQGKVLLDSQATKKNFLEFAAQSQRIHLATHASSNPSNPLESFIAFYPAEADESTYKLFTHEIFNLPLHQLDLAFLSACETGSGRLESGEGVLSLSRAFARAGCDNMVISLWKAADQPTAYISRHFYEHVDKGCTYPEALQKARMDLITDPDMAQFHSPVYWSHLIFIGNPGGPTTSRNLPALMAGSIVLLFMLLYSWYRIRNRSRSAA